MSASRNTNTELAALRKTIRHLAQENARLSGCNKQLAQERSRLTECNLRLAREGARLVADNRLLAEENARLAHPALAHDAQPAERDQSAQHNGVGAAGRTESARDEFVAMLAHELRNPLGAIHNAVQLMRLKPLQDPRLERSRAVIERQLAHLRRLLDDLLDVSRINHGKITLELRELAVAAMVTRAVEGAQPLVDEYRHALSVDMPDASVLVMGDAARLTQALGNLLSNAARYTGPGGSIRLRVLRRDREVELRVRDNGAGIDPQYLPHIFDLFSHAQRNAEPGGGGLGIGLALARRLVEMHGGSVTACSGGRGRGSEFTIRLPLLDRPPRGTDPGLHCADANSAREQLMSEADSASSSPTQRRILVADDNDDALESLATLLELSGHEVYTAANGAAALEFAEQHLPEVALLDIGMPKLDGYEVARRIRAQPWGRKITLVALTGWGQDSDRRRSHEAGFDSHLVKPLDLDKLTDLLATLPSKASA